MLPGIQAARKVTMVASVPNYHPYTHRMRYRHFLFLLQCPSLCRCPCSTKSKNYPPFSEWKEWESNPHTPVLGPYGWPQIHSVILPFAARRSPYVAVVPQPSGASPGILSPDFNLSISGDHPCDGVQRIGPPRHHLPVTIWKLKPSPRQPPGVPSHPVFRQHTELLHQLLACHPLLLVGEQRLRHALLHHVTDGLAGVTVESVHDNLVTVIVRAFVPSMASLILVVNFG